MWLRPRRGLYMYSMVRLVFGSGYYGWYGIGWRYYYCARGWMWGIGKCGGFYRRYRRIGYYWLNAPRRPNSPVRNFASMGGLPAGPAAGESPSAHRRKLLQSLSTDTKSSVQYLGKQIERLDAFFSLVLAVFGGESKKDWLTHNDIDWADRFYNAIADSSDMGAKLSPAEFDTLKEPLRNDSAVNSSSIRQFLHRWNRSLTYWENGVEKITDVPAGGSTDFVPLTSSSVGGVEYTGITELVDDYVTNILTPAAAEGLPDPFDGYLAAMEAIDKSINLGDPQGVCATVKIKIAQDAVLTRTAFQAKLTIKNNDVTPLSNITVTITIREEGQADSALGLFVIRNVTLTGGLTGVSGGPWSGLLANSEGAAEWLIIPTIDASAEEELFYEIGGKLSYLQDGTMQYIDIFPDTVKVIPEPLLNITYFFQRQVYADDPFTERVEPPELFSIGILVENEGFGTAKNFRITSAQPNIVANKKDLLVAFKLHGTQVYVRMFWQTRNSSGERRDRGREGECIQ